MKRRSALLVVATLLASPHVLVACSPGPMPVAQSAKDPSSPTAPEGVSPLVVASAPSGPRAAASSHEGHHHPSAGDDGAAAYVCPMHPEVTSTSPGVCPKCNMKLVPKK